MDVHTHVDQGVRQRAESAGDKVLLASEHPQRGELVVDDHPGMAVSVREDVEEQSALAVQYMADFVVDFSACLEDAEVRLLCAMVDTVEADRVEVAPDHIPDFTGEFAEVAQATSHGLWRRHCDEGGGVMGR